jgi:hypothetical protein
LLVPAVSGVVSPFSDVIGGSGSDSGIIYSANTLASVTIGGSLIGGQNFQTGLTAAIDAPIAHRRHDPARGVIPSLIFVLQCHEYRNARILHRAHHRICRALICRADHNLD